MLLIVVAIIVLTSLLLTSSSIGVYVASEALPRALTSFYVSPGGQAA
jgi:hypothetical protein